jgi:hypothetical protein
MAAKRPACCESSTAGVAAIASNGSSVETVAMLLDSLMGIEFTPGPSARQMKQLHENRNAPPEMIPGRLPGDILMD